MIFKAIFGEKKNEEKYFISMTLIKLSSPLFQPMKP